VAKLALGVGALLGLAVLAAVGGVVYYFMPHTLEWREEVALHDGGILVVSRRAVLVRGGNFGEFKVERERRLAFIHPTTGQPVVWENAGQVGSRLLPLLLDVDAGRVFLVTFAQSGRDYDDLGCPTPPYLVFRYDPPRWTRIPVAELPARFRQSNIISHASGAEDLVKQARYYITAAQVKAVKEDVGDKNSPDVVVDRRIRNPLALECDRDALERVYGVEKYNEWRGTGTWLDKSPEEVAKLLGAKGKGVNP
jgi:hypothetical protein